MNLNQIPVDILFEKTVVRNRKKKKDKSSRQRKMDGTGPGTQQVRGGGGFKKDKCPDGRTVRGGRHKQP